MNLAEATFKPKELKEQLKSGNDLIKILKNTLNKKDANGKSSKPRRHTQTRYEKVLQEFFQRKESSQNKYKPNRKDRNTPEQIFPEKIIEPIPLERLRKSSKSLLSHRTFSTKNLHN